MVQLGAGQAPAVRGARGEQLVHVHPAALVQREAYPLRLVPQHQRQELRRLDRPLLVQQPRAPRSLRAPQTPWLTELMLKSGTRSAGAAARVK